MPPIRADLTNQKFGQLRVLRYSHKKPSFGGHWRHYWVCSCVCGNQIVKEQYVLTKRLTKSCKECSRKRACTHGMSRSPEFQIWMGMIKRCADKSNANYGGRGIHVCKAWLNSFKRFYSDMGKRPSTKHSLDRVDNDGPYKKSNCRWATAREQRNNTRFNIKLTIDGETRNLNEWLVHFSLPQSKKFLRLVYTRLWNEWDPKKALLTPTRVRKYIYRGIFFESRTTHEKHWGAYISNRRKKQYLGYFKTAKEAASAYDARAKQLYGAKAKLNFPE